MQEMQFDSWVMKSPWRRKWQPVPVFLPGKSPGQRSLAGYSPWRHKSDTTESMWAHAHTLTHTYTHTLFQIVINVCFVFFIILYLLGIITSVYLQGIITTNSCVTTSWVKTEKILKPWKAPSYHFPIIVHFLLYKRNRHPGFYGNHFPGFSL